MIWITSRFLIKVLTFNSARAITMWPFIIFKNKKNTEDVCLINHEKIHIRQQAELLIIPFYVLYLLEYAYHRIKGLNHLQAYLNISFEKEAYANEENLEYLSKRSFWAWRKYY